MHPLHLIADLDAAHTADAAVLDPHHGVAEIRGDIPQILDVVLPQQIIIVGQLLKTAVSAAGTLGAADLMLAQKQPKITRRASRTRGEWVWITMPSATTLLQEGIRRS